jgi:ribonuclease HI
MNGGGSLILGQLGITNVDPLAPVQDTTINPHPPDDIVCFSDGSCLKNGCNGASAGYACVFPNHPKYTSNRKLDDTEEHVVTNNRAEYTALIHAMDICKTIDPSMKKPLYFYTDSQLLINTATKWICAWKNKGWRKADGTTVLNIDLIQTIDALLKTRKVVFKHVQAHTGNKDWFSVYNDQADQLAKAAAQLV